MKRNVTLTVTSLLSLLSFTFHLTGDITRGYAGGGAPNLAAVPIAVVWLYGTLVLAERRSGRIIMSSGRVVGLQITQRVLNARQKMLEQRRIPKDGWPVPDRAIEYPAFLIAADPAHRKILVLAANRQYVAVGSEAGLFHIDAQEYVQMIA